MEVTRVRKIRDPSVTDHKDATKKGEIQVLTAVARDESERWKMREKGIVIMKIGWPLLLF